MYLKDKPLQYLLDSLDSNINNISTINSTTIKKNPKNTFLTVKKSLGIGKQILDNKQKDSTGNNMYLSNNITVDQNSNILPELLSINRALSNEEKDIIKKIETIKTEYRQLLNTNQYGKLGELNKNLTELRNKLKQSYASASVTTTKEEYEKRTVNNVDYRTDPTLLKSEEIISGVPNYVLYGGVGLIGLFIIYSMTGKK
jgi:hypothetical protein